MLSWFFYIYTINLTKAKNLIYRGIDLSKLELKNENQLFEDIPLNQDCYLVSDSYLNGFTEVINRISGGEVGIYPEVGGVACASIRKINNNSLELSWYPSISERFHEVSISLPKDKFRQCIYPWQYDLKPYIFVDQNWLEQLYLKEYSVFALIDAIGVKKAMQDGVLTKDKLIELRGAVDKLAHTEKSIAFISFADSLILKANWTVGYCDKRTTYNPEEIIKVIKKLDEIYKKILGLPIYAVLTQGGNEYEGEPLIHISTSQNHICLNSLGIPFAELLAIESAAKNAIKRKIHPPAQLYLDEQFYRSIQFKFEFQKNDKPKNHYSPIMKSVDSNYFYTTYDTFLENLDDR